MKEKLTDRQKIIFEYVKNSIDENGYPPTFREIGREFDIASTFGVKRHIDALIKKGYLKTESNTSRTISVVGNFQSSKNNDDPFIEIPVVGRIAAGYPMLAEENIETTLSIHKEMIGRYKECFGLKVRGDSMINAGILEGDFVIANRQREVKNEDIVVALLGDEATLKRYRKEKDETFLIPENENYKPIKVTLNENFSIIGKVITVFRFYN